LSINLFGGTAQSNSTNRLTRLIPLQVHDVPVTMKLKAFRGDKALAALWMLCFLLYSAAGSDDDDATHDVALDVPLSGIVGGRPAAAGRYPFFVQSDPAGCGATLIHEDIVLTAAHCEFTFYKGVSIGGVLVDGSDAEKIPIESRCVHPNYTTPITYDINDIMLVKLSKPSKAPLVRLNFDASIPAAKDVVTGIGFGNTIKGGFSSPILMQVKLDTYADQACADEYIDYVPKTLICAGTFGGGKDTCQGDSGGPLLASSSVKVGSTMFTTNSVQVGKLISHSDSVWYDAWLRPSRTSNCLSSLLSLTTIVCF
jgi:trypsin